MLHSPLLYQIPEALVDGYMSGDVRLFGAILKEAATGRILGHVQQTSVLGNVLGSVLNAGGTIAGAPVTSLISGVAIFQNEQIKSRLGAMQHSLGLLQNMQVGALALSGIGLGVSVVGFAAMNRKLCGISRQIATLDEKLDRVTADRRSDDLEQVMRDIGSDIDTVEGLGTLRDRRGAAERASESLRRNAARLVGHFEREAARGRPDIARLLSVGHAIRLCHEAGNRALFLLDEVGNAAHHATVQAERFMKGAGGLVPDRLAQSAARDTATVAERRDARRAALPDASAAVADLRSHIAMIASQADLARSLLARAVSGPAYLEALEAEEEAPLVMLSL